MTLLLIIISLTAVLFIILYFQKSIALKKNAQDLKSALTKIKTEKLLDKALLESIGEGVVATDKDGSITFLNNVAAESLLWNSTLMGKKLSEVSLLADENGVHVGTEKHPLHMCIVNRKKITTKDYHFIRHDGLNVAVHISATPVMLNDEIIGAVEVFRDITKEKEIDRAKTEFVYLASHQLRTPLSTINWYLELILTGDAGPINVDQKKYLQEAYQSNLHMVELVNEFLNVSRLDLGTMVVQSEPVDLPGLIQEVISEIAPLVDKKKLDLIKHIPKSTPSFKTDPKLIRMVFQNLLTNAVKYTPEKGKIKVSITTNKQNLQIAVQDTGYGIPKDAQDKVFTKLFRADNVKEREPGGTGLGLYVVKAVVEQLGGKIWFASPPNHSRQGTAFYITLPLTKSKKKPSSNTFLEKIK